MRRNTSSLPINTGNRRSWGPIALDQLATRVVCQHETPNLKGSHHETDISARFGGDSLCGSVCGGHRTDASRGFRAQCLSAGWRPHGWRWSDAWLAHEQEQHTRLVHDESIRACRTPQQDDGHEELRGVPRLQGPAPCNHDGAGQGQRPHAAGTTCARSLSSLEGLSCAEFKGMDTLPLHDEAMALTLADDPTLRRLERDVPRPGPGQLPLRLVGASTTLGLYGRGLCRHPHERHHPLS